MGTIVLNLNVYHRAGGSEPHLGRSLALEEDDALLQFALHQSLLGATGTTHGATMDVWEALKQDTKADAGG